MACPKLRAKNSSDVEGVCWDKFIIHFASNQRIGGHARYRRKRRLHLEIKWGNDIIGCPWPSISCSAPVDGFGRNVIDVRKVLILMLQSQKEVEDENAIDKLVINKSTPTSHKVKEEDCAMQRPTNKSSIRRSKVPRWNPEVPPYNLLMILRIKMCLLMLSNKVRYIF